MSTSEPARGARRLRVGVVVAIAQLACAHAPDRVRFTDAHADLVAKQLEDVRGLRFRSPVKVIELSTRQLANSMGSQAGAIGGFYNHDVRLLVVKKELPPGMYDEVLAHELEHALQFQTFPQFIQHRTTPDGELVRNALAEGDATLAEALWLRAYGGPQKSDAVERLAATGLTSEHGPSDWNVSHLADELSAFGLSLLVHQVGPQFLAILYQHGGLTLVNRMLDDPPQTTGELMHPDRYLRGEKPVELSVPAALAGKGMGGFLPLGELRLRSLLDHCSSRAEAISVSSAWDGDGLTLVHASRDELFGFRWVTLWRSQAAARAFEETARHQVACFARALSGKAENDPLQELWVVRRQGRTVVLDRGPIEESEIQGLLASAPPALRDEAVVGEVAEETKPLAKQGERAWKTLGGGKVANDELGLTVSVPAGFKVTHREEEQIAIESEDLPAATMTVRFRRAWSGEEERPVADEAAENVVAKLQGNFHADGNYWDAFSGPLGRGTEKAYRLRETPQVHLRVVVITACQKTGFDVVTQTWSRDEDGKKLDALAHAIEVKAQRPICDQ